MPRTIIDLPERIEYLSILDADGHVDNTLLPDLSGDQLRHFHRITLLSRRFDERLLSLQRQGRIGTFAPIKGQEASQIGAVAALRAEDWVVPAFRETAAVELPSPFTGVVEEIKVKKGDIVQVGDVLLTFAEMAGEEIARQVEASERTPRAVVGQNARRVVRNRGSGFAK